VIPFVDHDDGKAAKENAGKRRTARSRGSGEVASAAKRKTAMIFDGSVILRNGDRLFERIYLEKTGWRFKESDIHGPKPNTTKHVWVETSAWFHEGIVLIDVVARIGDQPYFAGDDNPAGLTVLGNTPLSAAIRIAIKAHDSVVERVKSGLPESAERVS
jgi:hypothetical protein